MQLVHLQCRAPTALAIVLLLNAMNSISSEKKSAICIQEEIRYRPRTSLQVQSYINLAHDSDVFVDKSLFIKDIMEDKNKKILITCPRRWGKTINLNMVKLFFEIQVDENGTRIPIESSRNYHLFAKGNISNPHSTRIKRLKKPPLIGQHTEFVEKYLGRHPVISLDIGFLQINPGLMWIMRGVLQQVIEAHEDHDYMRRILQKKIDEKTDPEAPATLALFNEHLENIERLPVKESAKSLVFLSRILCQQFKSKVIMLLDIYDLSLDSVLGEPYFVDSDRDAFLNFYEDLMEQTLNKNEYIEKVVITGMQYPPEAFMKSIFSESDTTIGNVLTGNYMEYFGFNQWDMKLLYEFYNTPYSKQKEMEEWYGGHKVNGRKLQIFVPYSVVHCFRRRRVEWFWTRTKEIQLTVLNFCEIELFTEKLRQLCNGSEITVTLKSKYFTYKDWSDANRIFLCHEDGPLQGNPAADRGLYLFFMHGYLTLAKDYNSARDGLTFHFKFPNREILLTLKYDLEKFFKQGPFKFTGVDVSF